MVGRLTSPFSTKIDYIKDKVLGRDFRQLTVANDAVTA